MRRPTVDVDANLRRERFKVSGQIIKQACRQRKNCQTLVQRCDVCNFMKVSKIKQIVEQNGMYESSLFQQFTASSIDT